MTKVKQSAVEVALEKQHQQQQQQQQCVHLDALQHDKREAVTALLGSHFAELFHSSSQMQSVAIQVKYRVHGEPYI